MLFILTIFCAGADADSLWRYCWWYSMLADSLIYIVDNPTFRGVHHVKALIISKAEILEHRNNRVYWYSLWKKTLPKYIHNHMGDWITCMWQWGKKKKSESAKLAVQIEFHMGPGSEAIWGPTNTEEVSMFADEFEVISW